MADDIDPHSAVMPPDMRRPTAAAALRAEITLTRLRLATSIGDAKDMAAPSRLITTGAQVVRRAAGRELAGLAGRVSDESRMPASSRLGSVIALALAAVVTTVVARRHRGRHSRTSPSAITAIVTSLLRPRSPWMMLALAAFAAVSRRR